MVQLIITIVFGGVVYVVIKSITGDLIQNAINTFRNDTLTPSEKDTDINKAVSSYSLGFSIVLAIGMMFSLVANH